MADTTYILFAASYQSLFEAEDDLLALKALQKEGEIRKVTAAMVTKNEKGRIKVHETTHAGKVAGGGGLLAGAVIGAIFPPAGLAVVGGALAGAAVLGTVGATMGHFAGGVSRKDLKELGTLLDEGQAALIAVAEDVLATDVDAALSHATRKARRALDKDDVSAALADIEEGVKNASKAASE